jgi:hypothetical protein
MAKKPAAGWKKDKQGIIGVTAVSLFLLNFIPGILLLNEGLFHADAVILAQAVEKTYATGVLQPAVWGRYGSVIINIILHLPFFLSGSTSADFTIRFSSLLFHSLSIAVFFLFIRELFQDYLQALFAALLLSFTPLYFSPNTYGKEQGAGIFFLLLSLYLLYRGANRKSYPLICLSSFLIAFSITVRESALLAVPFFFLLYFEPRISLRPFKINIPKERLARGPIVCLFLPFTFVFAFIFAAYFRQATYQEIFIHNTARVTYLGLYSNILKAAFSYLFTHGISLLVIPFFIIGAVRMLRDKKIFFTIYFLLWFIFLFLYIGNLDNFNPRLFDIVIIPVYVFVSYALTNLYAKDKPIALSLVAVLVLLMFAFIYPILKSRHNYNGEKQFALYVKEKTEPNAVVLAVDDACFIEYYGERNVLTVAVGEPAEMDALVEKIKGYLERRVSVYVVSSSYLIYGDDYFKNKFADNFYGTVTGKKLSEDYHWACVDRRIYEAELIKLSLKDGRDIK